ncbi:MAG TPA: YidB family protein [Roseomonas sp.]|nr:YidB family protein [Roseomonas sp.]
MSGFFSGRSGGGLTGGLSNGVKMAAIAFLVQQLMKHSRQEGAASAAPTSASPAEGTGGLGGLLGGLLGGGAAGGGLLGGLGGLLGQLRAQGLGSQVDSWVRPGENHAVSPQELERHLDPNDLDAAAQQAGTDRQSLLEELSRTLPQFVDHATPQGQVPQREEEIGGEGIGGLLSSLLQGGQARQR